MNKAVYYWPVYYLLIDFDPITKGALLAGSQEINSDIEKSSLVVLLKNALLKKQEEFHKGIDQGIEFQAIKILFKEIKELEQQLEHIKQTKE